MSLLLTGGTGYLGAYLIKSLAPNYEIVTIGRSLANDLIADFGSSIPPIQQKINQCVHASGKAHIYPKSQADIDAFHQINVIGTQNLLNVLKPEDLKRFVFISSVSVYGLSSGENITEQSPLLGNSAYALSKIRAEELVVNWCETHKVQYLILRLPLIAGVNPPGNLGAMIKGIRSGKYARIAKGVAHKSMVHAEDVAELIKGWLMKDNALSGIYNLTDGIHPSFFDIEEKIKKDLGKKRILQIPSWVAKMMAAVGDKISFIPINSNQLRKITDTFTFSDAKARHELGWNPKPALSRSLIKK